MSNDGNTNDNRKAKNSKDSNDVITVIMTVIVAITWQGGSWCR